MNYFTALILMFLSAQSFSTSLRIEKEDLESFKMGCMIRAEDEKRPEKQAKSYCECAAKNVSDEISREDYNEHVFIISNGAGPGVLKPIDKDNANKTAAKIDRIFRKCEPKPKK